MLVELIQKLQVPTMEPYEVLEEFLKGVPQIQQKQMNIIGQILINGYSELVNPFSGEEGYLFLEVEEAMDIAKKECVSALIEALRVPTENAYISVEQEVEKSPNEFKELIENIGMYLVQEHMEPVNPPYDLRAVLPLSEEEALKKIQNLL